MSDEVQQATAPAAEAADRRRRITGIVVSDKMQKTIVVRVERTLRHPIYKKVLTRGKNFKAHDPNGEAHEGDTVTLVEFRPVSKSKRWLLETIVQRKA
jgi:small subunit ribosomal protein S17